MIPKPKREIDKDYLEFVKLEKCIICGRWPSDAHHSISRGSGGGDYYAVSLCREHHSEGHTIGWQTFQSKYELCFNEEIVQMLLRYISHISDYNVETIQELIRCIKEIKNENT